MCIGENISIERLDSEYDAVVLCIGSTIPKDIILEGRDLSGIHFAMDFLPQQNKRVSYEEDNSSPILANNKHVIVIGQTKQPLIT